MGNAYIVIPKNMRLKYLDGTFFMVQVIMNDILRKFEEACILKGEADELGNSKKGNKQYKVIHSAYLSLKKNNRLDELASLLDHENPYVRLWASAYTLQISQAKAEKTLQSLSKIKGNVGFCSEMTLREWENGSLKFE